jgi:hypothetical protein
MFDVTCDLSSQTGSSLSSPKTSTHFCAKKTSSEESGRCRKIEYSMEEGFAELSGRRTSEGVREKAVLADVGR